MNMNTPCVITDARQAIQTLMACLQLKKPQDAAKAWNMYQSHVSKLLHKNTVSLQTLEKIKQSSQAQAMGLDIVVGTGESEPLQFTPENCNKAYHDAVYEGKFKDFHELHNISGIAYVTGYDLTKARKPKTRLDTILKFAQACNVRFRI